MTISQETNKYSLESTSLFKPIKIGEVELLNRIFFAPTTRRRSSREHVPSDLNLDHYDLRSKDNGGLIIAEATFISEQASGSSRVPGIWSKEQLLAWKKIVDTVHKNGSYISSQLWYLGRMADPLELKAINKPYVSSSGIYINEENKKQAEKLGNPLRALTLQEIEELKLEYLNAAKNAIQVAGFDFVELHDAHGYLLDQFLQPSINQRTDKYGGSIENRTRFVLEVIDLLILEVGASKIGIRISPWAQFGGLLGENESINPILYQGYLLSELNKRKIAYVSIVEPRVQGNISVGEDLLKTIDLKSNDWVYQIFKGAVLRAGNYLGDREEGFLNLKRDVEKFDRTLIGVSRYFTSNPDLVQRLKHGWELTPYDRPHFYTESNYHYNTWARYGKEEIRDEEFSNRKAKPLL